MNRFILIFLLLFPLSLVGETFQKVAPGKEFVFPADHGAHPQYPIEWWYFTGHLSTKEARTFGFELTFFRVGMNPSDKKQNVERSLWHVDSLYIAHAAITDDQGQRFVFEKRTKRPSFDQAGASSRYLEVWLDDWKVVQKEDGSGHGTFNLTFRALDKRKGIPFSLHLLLNSIKPPVLQGKDGYSQKGEESHDASYYVTFTRLLGDGKLTIQDQSFSVSASAWMDHEVLSSEPNNKKVGWDWFAVQLDNQYECMLYHLKRDGEVSPYSSGGCVSPSGEKVYLSHNDYQITPTKFWTSPHTKIRYPSEWKLEIIPLNMRILVAPTLNDQELVSDTESTRTYWEGRNLVKGTHNDVPVSGAAYVELVGY